MNAGFLLGPATDNQLSTLVGVDHSGFPASGDSLLTDADGDIFIVDPTFSVVKYDSSLAQVWSYPLTGAIGSVSTNFTPGLRKLSIAADGGVYFGTTVSAALAGEVYGGATDAVVVKISAAGTLDWAHQIGSSGQEYIERTIGLPDGSVIASGSSTGQLPGKPASVLKGAWMARYEADGTRAWLQQYEKTSLIGSGEFLSNGNPGGDGDFALDASGNITMISGSKLANVDVTQGTVLGEFTKAPLTNPLADYVSLYVPFGLTPDGFYTWTSFAYSTDMGGGVALAKFSLEGVLLWYREFEPARTAVIDSVEGVIWTGTLDKTRGFIAVASDAVYVTGSYTNSYENGSIARPTTKNLFVAKYSLSGDRVWFQEFSFQGDTANTLSSRPYGLVLDPAGNPVVAVAQTSMADGFIFKLSAEDGSVM